jgi:hypothetical protein
MAADGEVGTLTDLAVAYGYTPRGSRRIPGGEAGDDDDIGTLTDLAKSYVLSRTRTMNLAMQKQELDSEVPQGQQSLISKAPKKSSRGLEVDHVWSLTGFVFLACVAGWEVITVERYYKLQNTLDSSCSELFSLLFWTVPILVVLLAIDILLYLGLNLVLCCPCIGQCCCYPCLGFTYNLLDVCSLLARVACFVWGLITLVAVDGSATNSCASMFLVVWWCYLAIPILLLVIWILCSCCSCICGRKAKERETAQAPARYGSVRSSV